MDAALSSWNLGRLGANCILFTPWSVTQESSKASPAATSWHREQAHPRPSSEAWDVASGEQTCGRSGEEAKDGREKDDHRPAPRAWRRRARTNCGARFRQHSSSIVSSCVLPPPPNLSSSSITLVEQILPGLSSLLPVSTPISASPKNRIIPCLTVGMSSAESMASACKADTVAAAPSPNLLHQHAPLGSAAPESPLSLPEARIVARTSAMDAGQSQTTSFSTEQDGDLHTQPLAPSNQAFSLENSSRLIQEAHLSYVDSHKRDAEELDRVVRRAHVLRQNKGGCRKWEDSKLQEEATEELVEDELSKYVGKEAEARWRCKMPECTKLFKAQNFWRKHVQTRHPHWRESLQAEALSEKPETLVVESTPPPQYDEADIANERSSQGRASTSFLSLPPSIRIRIYSYVLTDADSKSTLVGIKRQLQLPCYKLTRPLDPTLTYSLAPQPKSSFTTSILRTNKQIYAEALAILYFDKIFCLHDVEGLLLLFLEQLSERSRSCIRTIRLPAVPLESAALNKRKARAFHWAITCAQIAKLNDTLQALEISGQEILDPGASKQLLHPLCKVKATKRLVHSDGVSPEAAKDEDLLFNDMLQDAAAFLKSNAKVREERTKAEAKERADRIAREKEELELRRAAWAAQLARKEKAEQLMNEKRIAELKERLEREEREVTALKEKAAAEIYEGNSSIVPHGTDWPEEREMRNEQLAARLKTQMDKLDAESSGEINAIASRIHELERPSMSQWMDWPKAATGDIDQDLTKVKGLDQFTKELAALEELEGEEYEIVRRSSDLAIDDDDALADWDVVSVQGGSSPTKEDGHDRDDEWEDAASTLVGNDRDDADESTTRRYSFTREWSRNILGVPLGYSIRYSSEVRPCSCSTEKE
ncbi:uncharacterized protein BDZ99DRAFT_551623 [Mytilinidion resinicola]|uniref:C2H2-type domain-containing protein n=1 Tax=Mytilinidion resinicola TaxID=574789 RepID=A0A6A6Y2Q4_9PEZI|nr:uncharacterized protein BDZ99DRAFT_551623 [Mytilinidion resinicola]KAF2802294.1 hypothetical protein BDZ99DRAFT_551623 [Mytilinidion resinicola]